MLDRTIDEQAFDFFGRSQDTVKDTGAEIEAVLMKATNGVEIFEERHGESIDGHCIKIKL